MYIERVPNRGSPPAVLLRESYRANGRVKKRTLANLSHLPAERIEALRLALAGKLDAGKEPDDFEIVRSRPHGHVAAVLGTLRRLGLHTLIAARPRKERNVLCALIVSRILDPRSKLATVRQLRAETLSMHLGEVLGLTQINEDQVYAAMDWLLTQQPRIERELARRHLQEGTLVLYDLTSTWFEGRCCPLAKLGHSRDGKKGKLQIVIGLLCDPQGRPIAVEVFDGNTGDPNTLAAQVKKITERFKLERVVFVGDRGMITAARIREDLAAVEGLDWITSLRSPQIRALVQSGSLQLSLFDRRGLAEIRDPQFPGERLIACLNPLLKQERARKREDLLRATEGELERIVEATRRERRPLRGEKQISLRVGKVVNRFKVGKHFVLEIGHDFFRFHRNEQSIAEEAKLDGIYVIRSSVPADVFDAEQNVTAYKSLSYVERAFRATKTVDLRVRPIFHYLADRVRAHVFLCMLAYYVEWHMRQALAPILFEDHDRSAAQAARASIVAPAQRSSAARRKAATKRTDDGLPVHSLRSLLADLATITRNTCRFARKDLPTFEKTTTPTPLQQRALDLLAVPLDL